MKHYFKVYLALLKINFTLFLTYRSYFVYSTLVTCFWGLFQIIWVTLLTSKVSSFRGWTRDELILIAANYVFIVGIFHLFFSRNFDRLSFIVNKGDFDLVLIKPIDPQFTSSVFFIALGNVFRVAIGLSLIIYLIRKIGISITFFSFLNWLILVFFAIVLTYSIWLIFITLIFRYPRLSNIIEFLYNINGMSRFPPEMLYETKSFILLVLVPFTLSAAIPTKALFNALVSKDVFLLLTMSFGLFFLSRIVWKLSLKSYTSASS